MFYCACVSASGIAITVEIERGNGPREACLPEVRQLVRDAKTRLEKWNCGQKHCLYEMQRGA